VLAIFVSACVVGVEAVNRLLHPVRPDQMLVLAGAGAIGFVGNWLAARVRLRAGARLDSPALVADGRHAQADAYVSLGVVASAPVVGLGRTARDPLIDLLITAVILRITGQSWRTVRADVHHHFERGALARNDTADKPAQRNAATAHIASTNEGTMPVTAPTRRTPP